MADGKNYQIMDLVATGGTAVLYRAVQTSLDRVVAVKKLHHHLTTDENFTRRFALEAKAAASLDHENIVKIIDFGVEDGTYMMVMEFIDGESLKDILEKWKRLPANLALSLVHQICLGLEHAHAKGIVHRDIKPGNIMLTRTGKVKITDFGLAKLSQAQTQYTAANSILGTPLYMSPEQAFGESVDQRSDLFSLGTVLYECLTGHQPFQGENYMGVIQNIIRQNAPHPSRLGLELPDAVATIVVKAMNKNRDARYQGAREFRLAIESHLGLDALKQATDNLRSLLATDGATVVLPQTERARKRSRRIRRIIAVAVAVAVVAGVILSGHLFIPDTLRVSIAGLFAQIGAKEPPDSPGPWGDLASAGMSDGLAHVTRPDTGGVRHGVSPSEAVYTDSAATEDPADAETANSAVTENPAPTDGVPDTPADTVPSPDAATVARNIPQKVGTGWLSVTSEPPAETYVDERYVGDTPLARLELTSGPHTLECRCAKHETYRETLVITTGELSTRRIFLSKLLGRVSLSTIEGAEVYVDGTLIGVTPLEAPIELEAGRHQLTIRKPGFHVWNNSVVIDAKQLLPLRISLSPIY